MVLEHCYRLVNTDARSRYSIVLVTQPLVKIEMEFKVRLNVKARAIIGRIYVLVSRLNLTFHLETRGGTGSTRSELHENNVIPHKRDARWSAAR